MNTKHTTITPDGATGVPRVALITGATQGLGLALAQGLTQQLAPSDTVYVTGRDPLHIDRAVASIPPGAHVIGQLLDVADPTATAGVAERIRQRHGGIDIVINNAVMRVGPDDDPRDIVGPYAEVNNFGTTRVLRGFAPLLRDGGRLVVIASSLGTLHYLAPVLHSHFDDSADLDAVDRQVSEWRDAVADGSARGGPWPGFVNIPSKIGQVAAVRAIARQRHHHDAARSISITAVCPGMINTPTSSVWWDVSGAPSPTDAARPLVNYVLEPIASHLYGQLVRNGEALSWKPVLDDHHGSEQ